MGDGNKDDLEMMHARKQDVQKLHLQPGFLLLLLLLLLQSLTKFSGKDYVNSRFHLSSQLVCKFFNVATTSLAKALKSLLSFPFEL
jgi:hypothetical protein